MPRVRLALALAGLAAGLGGVATVPDAAAQQKTKKAAQPPAVAGKAVAATDPATMKVAKGFQVELLYTVPKDTQGSWVCLTTDPKGRLIASDQYGGLYRVTPPPAGAGAAATKVEKLPTEIGNAQGLLYAFDALYVVVNGGDKSGLYRITDTNNDDIPDRVELLRKFEGHPPKGGLGEHGPHAVLRHPDGKRLTVVCGNQTRITPYTSTRVPPVWGEDHLLPRLPDGNGFMAEVMGPGGAIYNVSPDGKEWELFSVGFRNQYDAAYNAAGDLFTYDADMEWDFNTPWYRPTRVCLVTSGSEFGWRNGAGKFPPYYLDNLPAVANIGPGSPTGVAFGYGARFPARYQNAFYICDWSYGKLYAVHLAPDGGAYKAEVEEFITGTPLPLTDIVVNPADGAMYFTIGGRRTTSGLYRVTYTGAANAPDAVRLGDGPPAEQRRDRMAVEAFHGKRDAAAVPAAWKELDTKDRYTAFAARVALEHQDPTTWADKALAEANPAKAIPALLALARVSAADPFHRRPGAEPANPVVRDKILAALGRIDLGKLDDSHKLDLLRTYQVTLNRFGKPDAAAVAALVATLGPALPDKNRLVNAELCQVLIYLDDPAVAAKTMKLLADAPTQEEQLEYMRALRVLRTGWTPELRREYFTWFVRAANFRGGNSMGGSIRRMKADAVATLTPAEATALKPIIDAQPGTVAIPAEAPRPFVKAYTVADLAPVLEKGLAAGGRDFDRGRRLFGAAKCFACHRFDNEGGSYGPDLSGLAGRFTARDLLESTVDPSKEISDQYAAVEIRTADERIVVGRIVNLNGDNVKVNTNMLDPNALTDVNQKLVSSIRPSRLSMMPSGLLDTFREDEIVDLMAYLLSRGDRTAAPFRKP